MTDLRGDSRPEVTPLLAASLTEPPDPRSPVARSDDRDPDWLLGWWEAYVRQVAPPVLHALFGHGVVLEPHLQNVLVGVDSDGLPVQAIFRDLEGVKLITARHDALLATLKPGVARALAYDAGTRLEPGRLLPVRQPPGRDRRRHRRPASRRWRTASRPTCGAGPATC